jgi:hypothetical protein
MPLSPCEFHDQSFLDIIKNTIGFQFANIDQYQARIKLIMIDQKYYVVDQKAIFFHTIGPKPPLFRFVLMVFIIALK